MTLDLTHDLKPFDSKIDGGLRWLMTDWFDAKETLKTRAIETSNYEGRS